MAYSGIATACDVNYLPYLKVLIHQLDIYSTNRNLFILFDGPEKNITEIEQFVSKYSFNARIIQVNGLLDLNDQMQHERHVSRVTYARLLMSDLLPSEVQLVLYLDIDILIMREIDSLFKVQLKSPLAGVLELDGNGFKLFGDSDSNYFNAGVLLIDLDYWKKKDLNSEVFSVLEKRSSLNFQDQDILNLIFQDNWQLLPMTANVFVDNLQAPMKLVGLEHPMIIHFNGPQKPWNSIGGKYHRFWRTQAKLVGVDEFHFEDSTFSKLVNLVNYNFRFSKPGIALRRVIPLKVKIVLNQLMRMITHR